MRVLRDVVFSGRSAQRATVDYEGTESLNAFTKSLCVSLVYIFLSRDI